MKLKLIIALVGDERTNTVIDAAREAGATGATIITSVRGEGLKPQKTFLGLELSGQRDVVLFMVAAERARHILETISEAGEFDSQPGSGVAFEVSIDDAVGLKTQLPTLLEEVEEEV